MDTNILAGICGRTHSILWSCLNQKLWYLENKLKKIEHPTPADTFLIERNEAEVEEIKILLCLIERSLFPPCGADIEEVSECDQEILKFLNSNVLIKNKLLERMQKSPSGVSP